MRLDVPPPYTPPETTTTTTTQLVVARTIVTPKVGLALTVDPTTHDVLISLVPPKVSETLVESQNGRCTRSPVDICCVIDISGSMDWELKASLEEGKAAELTGLTTLDVVKHAVKTIVATMQPDDRISIVTFSDAAEVTMGLTQMTASGKMNVLRAVEGLRTLNGTNMWHGLKTGMNVLNGLEPTPGSYVAPPGSAARLSSLFLLTDGMPNINPPRGILQMLISYLDTHPLTFSIHTFGFGYSLKSQLLLQIARQGHGVYGFIPDASALGAVFIHAVANLYSTCADRVELSVEYPVDDHSQNIAKLDIYDGQEFTMCSWGAKIEVGTVQYGQTRDFVFGIKDYARLVETSDGPVVSVTMRYRPWTCDPGDEPLTCTASLSREDIANGASQDDLVKLKHHLHRLAFLCAVDSLFKSSSASSPSATALSKFKSILSSLQTPPLSDDTSASALAQDLTGEVLLALSSQETYSRWGQHYLPSLARWHLLEQCGSYRDPGLQVYGSESPLFVKSRDTLDRVFDNLPPPQPTSRRVGHRPSTRHYVGTPGTMSATFASRSGPCFNGTCQITLMDGHNVPLRNLRKGVQVQTPKGAREVIAVLETPVHGGEALLCDLPGGLRITPWHPIKLSSNAGESWCFPASQATPELQSCNVVYSLLLEPDSDPNAHGVYVQNVLCVTLGHGITHSRCDVPSPDIRTHAFLGDYERIVQSLALLPDAGADDGVFRIGGVIRHSVSGLICGFAPCDDTMIDRSNGGSVRRISVAAA